MWGASTVERSEKQCPISDFLKLEKTHAPISLNNDAIRQGIFQAISKKKFGLRTCAVSDQEG
jgi:hypothetical protein